MFQRHLSEKLALLVDGQLNPDEHARAEAHLAACAECRAAARPLSVRRGMLREITLVEAPASIWTAIEEGWPGGPG